MTQTDAFPAPEGANEPDPYPHTRRLLLRGLDQLGGGETRHARLTTCAPESDWPELIELIELLAAEVQALRVQLIREREHARDIGAASALAAMKRALPKGGRR